MSLTSSRAGLSRYLVGHQCRQFVAVSSSLPAPHLPASSAHTPWLTAVLPARSQYPAKPESRAFSTPTPSKTQSPTFTRNGAAHCCTASATLVILPTRDSNPYPRIRAHRHPRGTWEASSTTYPSHLVQRCEHLLQLLHLLTRHRLIVSIQVLHVCAEDTRLQPNKCTSYPPKHHTGDRTAD